MDVAARLPGDLLSIELNGTFYSLKSPAVFVRWAAETLVQLLHPVAPHLTEDDMLQPHDHAEIANHPDYQFEDGILSGYLAVRAYVPDPARRARFSAVIGIIAFIDVPITFFATASGLMMESVRSTAIS